MNRRETYEINERELEELLERANRRGAQAILAQLSGVLKMQLGGMEVVSRDMIAAAYGVSEDTVKRWAARHGFTQVDGPNTRRVYYRWSECLKCIAELSET